MISIAVTFWSAFPDDADALVEHKSRAEVDGVTSHQRTRGLLLDEMLGRRVAQVLRDGGLDIVAVVDRVDPCALPDREFLTFAREDGRLVVTRNISDFARLDQQWQAAGRSWRGLVLVTEQAFPQNRNLEGALVRALLLAHERSELA